MNGILTDPRVLALQQAAKGKDPQAFRQELMARVDRGELPSSLVYVMNLQNRADLISKAMSPEQQQQAMQQPSVRQRLESAVANAAPPPQMPQGIPAPQMAPPMGGGLPSVNSGSLGRPGTFSAKAGGIVAFQQGGNDGLDEEEDEFPTVDVNQYFPAQPAAPAADPTLTPEAIAKMKPAELQAKGLGMVLQRRPRTSLESQEKARKAIADSLGVDKLNKEQSKMFKDAIKNIAARRDEAKAMFFLEAGAKIGASTQGLLGAVATGFAEPAAKLGKTRRELDVEERGVKGEKLKARREYVTGQLADFDRMVTARAGDEAAAAAEEARVGQGLMTYGAGRENVQLQREKMASDLARSKGQLTPLAVFQDDINAAVKALREAKTPDQIAAAQAQYDAVVSNMQKLQPQFTTGQFGLSGKQISAAVTAINNAAEDPNSNLSKLRNQKRLEQAKRDKANPETIAQLDAAIQAEESRIVSQIMGASGMPSAGGSMPPIQPGQFDEPTN